MHRAHLFRHAGLACVPNSVVSHILHRDNNFTVSLTIPEDGARSYTFYSDMYKRTGTAMHEYLYAPSLLFTGAINKLPCYLATD